MIIPDNNTDEAFDEYEFCPRCEANLTLQKGYSNNLPYWICLGCGEMLINPKIENVYDIAWICDKCGAMLNIQQGFNEDCAEWICTECRTSNKIDYKEVYAFEDEYRADLCNPYKGVSDADICELSLYHDEKMVGNSSNVILVKNCDTEELFIKKFLTVYDKSIYEYLKDNPIENMPRIFNIYEGSNCLILIEEYIPGVTVAELVDNKCISEKQAISISCKVCKLLKRLHSLPTPIIHRDIKPSNIMLTDNGDVYLLDMNVAKWYSPNKNDDTRYMGTDKYAAPEQVGFGLSSSSQKTDIYALGMLLNVMLTGSFPKEKKASGVFWKIIEKCISLEAHERYTTDELILELERIEKEYDTE